MMPYKKDFPILQQKIHGKPLVYLDNSASSQKPQCVIDAISNYYKNDHANVHRGVYELSQRATRAYEKTRETVQRFINAKHLQEIIFTSGATASINLVAQSFGRSQLKQGDEIILSAMEHHSNIVPWQLIAKEVGAVIRVVPIEKTGEMNLAAFQQLLSDKTKIVAIAHASNALGVINPIKKITEIAHKHNVPVLVDGAQAFPHLPVDVEDLDCDFYVFSSHKAYGPTGVGILYGKKHLLNAMPPFLGGGDMIREVTFEKTTYQELPFKFEAGTPNISAVVGFDAALAYLKNIGMENIYQHEQHLLHYATEKLKSFDGLTIIGTAEPKVGVISFVLEDIHPHDIATILDKEGIAIRAGHHCAMPLMRFFNVPATARMSFGIYNSEEDVDALIAGLKVVKRIFAHV